MVLQAEAATLTLRDPEADAGNYVGVRYGQLWDLWTRSCKAFQASSHGWWIALVVVVVRMSYTSFDAYSLFGRWRTLNQSLITCCKLQANVAPTKHKNKLAFSKVFKSI